MTFIANVLTRTDSNNSVMNGTGMIYSGTVSETTGYNMIIITIDSNISSVSNGLEIQFSDDKITYKTYYSDSYVANSRFTKNYKIIKRYYRIIYTNDTILGLNYTITSRLSTELEESNITNNGINIFDGYIESSQDAFGKLRTTQPFTLLDLRFSGDTASNNLLIENNIQMNYITTGSGTITKQSGYLELNTSGIGGVITQSRKCCIYQPGKSLLIKMSGVLDANNNLNTISRLGYYDDDNGLFFEYNNSILYVVVRKNGIDTKISQNDWNINKMDGSKDLQIDVQKTQLYVIDLEWLGVGRIRYGLYGYGRIQYCHQILNINVLTEPYTNIINLPIRYEIETDNISGSGSLRQICSTVISEGGYNPVGRPFSVNTNTHIDIRVNTETPIIAIRGKSSNKNMNIMPTSISLITPSPSDLILYRLRLYLGGNVPYTNSTGVIWSNYDVNNSYVEYITGSDNTNNFYTTFTANNSILIDQNYFFGKGGTTLNNLGSVFTDGFISINKNINGDSDILVLTAMKIVSGGGSSVEGYGSINWQEIY